MKFSGYDPEITAGRFSSLLSGSLHTDGGGRVHSIFQSSLNLMLADTMIHIDSGEKGLCAFGISLSRRDYSALSGRLCAGDPVRIRAGVIRFYGSYGVCCIRTGGLSETDLKLPEFLEECTESALAACRTLLRSEETGIRGHLGLPSEDRREAIFEKLRRADPADPGLIDQLAEAAAYLKGRGQGLTPAGDDILTGYGIAARFGEVGEPFLTALQRTPSRTTDVSEAYLSAMRQGYANELCLAFLTESKPGTGPDDARYRALQQVGHSSGWDTLFGLLLGLETLSLRERPCQKDFR